MSSHVPCRWLQKRILRYKHIKSHFSDEVLKCIEGPDGRTAPPLLPSLLATCAPAAELFLNVGPDEGKFALAGELCDCDRSATQTYYVMITAGKT